jgi:diguanylate cyclase (GGDEF)-like protein
VNDQHGHAAGDTVLAGVARAMRGALRDDDLPGRWGGEEFILALPGVDAPTAAKLVDRLRASVSAEVAHPAGGATRLTLSAGIATIGGGTAEDAMAAAQEAADAALYRAKAAGRDRVEVAS